VYIPPVFAIFILLLFAVGPLLSDDLRSQPLVWALSGLSWLGLIGLAYGKWREFQAREAMIEMNERDKRRGG
jgi:hypothetical protein